MNDDLLPRLLKEIDTLARCVEFDLATTPGRPLPCIPPDLLARYWPRIVQFAAELGRATLSEEQRVFLLTQAEMLGVRGAFHAL